MPTKLERASKDIFETLENHRIFAHSELQTLLRNNREKWDLPRTLPFTRFLQFLRERGKLREHRLRFPHRPATRYSWGDVDLGDIVQSIQREGYFSHFTAMQHHDLTEQISKTVYFNVEQQLSGGGTTPTQAGIDRAFKGKCRVSMNKATIGDRTVRLLNGRNTEQMGVVAMSSDQDDPKRVTNLERTLIDITVRPIYSGGVFLVAQAFASASRKVSVERLASYLRKLNYTYPYHQAIGYYMDRAGNYSRDQIQLIRDFGLDFDFYVDYGMKKTQYIEEWKLYVPEGF